MDYNLDDEMGQEGQPINNQPPNSAPPTPDYPPKYSYSKKNIWKWILLYLLSGAVAYGAAYYLFFSIAIPPKWVVKTNGEYGVALLGKEGGISIAWNGLGGACDPQYMEKIT